MLVTIKAPTPIPITTPIAIQIRSNFTTFLNGRMDHFVPVADFLRLHVFHLGIYQDMKKLLNCARVDFVLSEINWFDFLLLFIGNMICEIMFDDYDDNERVKNTISIIYRDRTEEFKEMASALGISQSIENWKENVMQFCLDFKECFKMFTGSKDPDISDASEHKQMDLCFTLMRQIGKGKANMRDVTYLQNISDMLAKEFQIIYKNIK